MMKNNYVISAAVMFISLLLIQSCNPPWDDHYSNQEDHINMTLWDAISQEPRFSTFVSKVKESGLDTILSSEQIYTLFIPDNEAFESITDTGDIMQSILPYHISETVFLVRNVPGSRKLLTTSGKYALIEAGESGYIFDGIPIEYNSPLFLNGKYYEISSIALPKPSLYDFTAQNSSVLKIYIDSKDSSFLDLNRSTPIGFDEEGRTIYDSVFGVVNNFEEKFFPVSQEFRDRSATFVIFTQELYELALDDMAERLGGIFMDHNDIPLEWQDNVLLPKKTENAMFDGDLPYSAFESGRLQSVTGDTVDVDPEKIDEQSRSICSNGVIYLYSDFLIEDELFRGTSNQEGEDLIDEVGFNKYAWKEDVYTKGEIIEPLFLDASVASGGAIVNVSFLPNFEGEYSVEFSFKNLFPMRYRLEWHANSRPSGIFAVYVNDQVLEYNDRFGNAQTEFDTYDLRQSVASVTGDGKRFFPVGGFNTKDYWIDHITDYGDIRIRFEYRGPGKGSDNGFTIDYIRLIPEF